MRLQIRALMGGLILAALLAGTVVCAAPQYAIVTTTSDVYMTDYSKPDTAPVEVSGSMIPPSITLGGVSLYNDYVFAAGSTGTSGKLYIGRINASGLVPTIKWLKAVDLSVGANQVINPASVAVDATGGVYVLNGGRPSTTYSSFAYLPSGSNWADAGLRIYSVPDTYNLADIATTGNASEAVMAQTMYNAADRQAVYTWVEKVTSGGASTPQMTGDRGCLPSAITIGNGLAYIVNRSTDDDGEGWIVDVGSISVVNATSLASASATAYSTGSFRPTDVSFFTIGTTNYLGMVGTGQNGAEARRVTLDAAGLPLMDSIVSVTLGISTSAHCAVSADNSTFWITSNPGAGGTITALNTNWTSAVNWTVPGQTQYVTVYTVPEPGGLLALLTGSVGLIGVLKRRRR